MAYFYCYFFKFIFNNHYISINQKLPYFSFFRKIIFSPIYQGRDLFYLIDFL